MKKKSRFELVGEQTIRVPVPSTKAQKARKAFQRYPSVSIRVGNRTWKGTIQPPRTINNGITTAILRFRDDNGETGTKMMDRGALDQKGWWLIGEVVDLLKSGGFVVACNAKWEKLVSDYRKEFTQHKAWCYDALVPAVDEEVDG